MRIAVVIGLLLIINQPCVAWAENYLYLGAHAGPTILGDTSLSGNFNPIELNFDTGYNFGATAGYELLTGRIEAEYAYRSAAIDRIEYLGQEFNPGGDFESHAFLLNAIAEYEWGTLLRPYVLLGAGYAQVTLKEDRNLGIDIADEQDAAFAYQAGAGVGIPINELITVDVGYRYFATEDLEFEATADRPIQAEYESHNLLTGLRLTF